MVLLLVQLRKLVTSAANSARCWNRKAVARVGGDLHQSLRDQPGQQVGVVGDDPLVAVAVRGEHGHLQRLQALQRRVVRHAPDAGRLELGLDGGQAGNLVTVLGPRANRRPRTSFPACWLAADAAKKALRYPSALDCAVPPPPTAPGAGPNVLGAPLGAEEARMRRLTRAGRRSAVSTRAHRRSRTPLGRVC